MSEKIRAKKYLIVVFMIANTVLPIQLPIANAGILDNLSSKILGEKTSPPSNVNEKSKIPQENTTATSNKTDIKVDPNRSPNPTTDTPENKKIKQAIHNLEELKFEFKGESFLTAIKTNNKTAIDNFIDAKIDPNSDSDGYPAIALAIELENSQVIEYLLKSGVNVNVKFNKPTTDSTVLHLVSKKVDLKMIELLAKAGADVNANDDDGINPFHLAFFAPNKSEIERIEAMNILIKYGAHPSNPMKFKTESGILKTTDPQHWKRSWQSYLSTAENTSQPKAVLYLRSLASKFH